MNDYIIYVNGILAPAGHGFKTTILTGSDRGRYLRLTSDTPLKDVPKRIDIFEVRASNIVRRYQWSPPEDGKLSDAGFDCLGVSNAF
jgi:hypothetical protein